MNWQIMDVLMSHADDIRTASALARVNTCAPRVHPRLIADERERRTTSARKSRLLCELTSLQRPVDLSDLLLGERDYRIDDRKSILEWCRIENEGVFLYTGHVDADGTPHLIDTSEYVPVLSETGFWNQA